MEGKIEEFIKKAEEVVGRPFPEEGDVQGRAEFLAALLARDKQLGHRLEELLAPSLRRRAPKGQYSRTLSQSGRQPLTARWREWARGLIWTQEEGERTLRKAVPLLAGIAVGGLAIGALLYIGALNSRSLRASPPPPAVSEAAGSATASSASTPSAPPAPSDAPSSEAPPPETVPGEAPPPAPPPAPAPAAASDPYAPPASGAYPTLGGEEPGGAGEAPSGNGLELYAGPPPQMGSLRASAPPPEAPGFVLYRAEAAPEPLRWAGNAPAADGLTRYQAAAPGEDGLTRYAAEPSERILQYAAPTPAAPEGRYVLYARGTSPSPAPGASSSALLADAPSSAALPEDLGALPPAADAPLLPPLPESPLEAATAVEAPAPAAGVSLGGASSLEGLPFVPGQQVPAVLATGVLTIEGVAAPVVAVSPEDWCGAPPCPTVYWIGSATIGPTKRLEVRFDRATLEGRDLPVQALALEPADKVYGLVAEVREEAPTVASDLLRAALSGVAEWSRLVAGRKDVVTLPDGRTIETTPEPRVEDLIAGRVANLFGVAPTQKALIRVAKVPAGKPILILYGVAPTGGAG